ncbi:hypothetical protein FPQ18DRAFT_121933 [Pyronema domesticum]|nr:hypothetical protein FPQ18DRAFT_121933 [Pyronema domesticum]
MEKQIEGYFQVSLGSITLSANADDIRRYVTRQLEMDDNYGDMDDSFKKEITDIIVDTADGMFLLSALQIATVLEKQVSRRDGRRLRQSHGASTKRFRPRLTEITRQVPARSNQGMEILKWTLLAKRQLTITELRHALAAIDTTDDYLDSSDLPFEKSLTDCCYGLVILNKETTSIRLVHKSLQEFLEKKHKNQELFKTGHQYITRICLKYTSLNDYDTTQDTASDLAKLKYLIDCGEDKLSNYYIEDTPKFIPSHLAKFPFLKYAIYFLGEHAKKQTNREITDMVVDWLFQKESSSCISRNLRSLVLPKFLIRDVFRLDALTTMSLQIKNFVLHSTTFVGLHLAAYFDLAEISSALIDQQNEVDVNSTAWTMQSPLQIAVVTGHENIARLLLARPDIDINLRYGYGYTALYWAVREDYEAILLILLEKGADSDVRCYYGETPLLF